MGKRFAILIGVAAVGVIALGAQTAAPAQAVVKYDTTLMITHEGCCTEPLTLWHGRVLTDRKECMGGRRVILFKRQPGADRKLGTDRSHFHSHVWISGTLPDATPVYGPAGRWGGWGAPWRGRVYARVTPMVGDGFVCRADRSRTIIGGKLCFEDPSFCPTQYQDPHACGTPDQRPKCGQWGRDLIHTWRLCQVPPPAGGNAEIAPELPPRCSPGPSPAS